MITGIVPYGFWIPAFAGMTPDGNLLVILGGVKG